MANKLRDLQFGWRMLRRNKGFSVVAILALALGIGPNVAIFSIIYATFFAPLALSAPRTTRCDLDAGQRGAHSNPGK